MIRPQMGLPLAVALIALAALPERSHAVPACPAPAILEQPDGTPVKVYLRGDEFKHWHEAGNGFSIVKEARSGQWRYAVPDHATGQLKASALVVGKDNPATLGVSPRLQPTTSSHSSRSSQLPLNLMSSPGTSNQTQAMPDSPLQNLVVLVEFADLAGSNSVADFEALFNEVGYSNDGAQGSVRDYYDEVSYGQLVVTSTIADWVTLPQGYAYYGANDGSGNDIRPREMVSDALSALEVRGFNFAPLDGNSDGWIDGLTIIHAGGGEEYGGNDTNYIWSHQWSLSSAVTYDGVHIQTYHTEPARRGFDSMPSTHGITRIGVICHETGHFIGLPDLYDIDYSSSGIGDFCLMSGASWNGNYGSLPGHMSAWCKADLEWITPTVITNTDTYTLNRASLNPAAYRLDAGLPSTEYFLIENRSGGGFDAELPGSSRGLLVWHIDEAQSNNNNENRPLVDLEEAGGTQELQAGTSEGDDRDYYRQGNNTQFSTNSIPNSYSYSGLPLHYVIGDVSASGTSMWFTIPAFLIEDVALLWESCTPTNGIVDEGEAVIMDVSLVSSAAQQINLLEVTLLSTNGITPLGDPATYGAFTGFDETGSQMFSFTADGDCGETLVLNLQLNGDGESLGMLQHPITLGSQYVSDSQSFDTTPSTLPSGWSTTATGSGIPWVITSSVKDTPPNACFGAEASAIGTSDLLSELFTPSSEGAIIRFRHQYDIENDAGGLAWDGGVLDLKIGTGSFTDVLTAGCVFLTNGYDHTIIESYGNPEGGRSAWSGDSGSFVTTELRLPPAAAGQSVRLRWRVATDVSDTATGWWVDTIELLDYVCCSNAPAILGVTPSSAVDFGGVTIGNSSNLMLDVVNTGEHRLLGSTSTDGAFQVATGAWYTVDAGATSRVTVSFAPSDAMSYSNALDLTSNGGNTSQPLLGEGLLLWIPALDLQSGTSLVVRATSTNGDASLWFKTDLNAPTPWQLHTNYTRQLDGSNYLFELPLPPAQSNLFLKVLSDPVD